MGQVVEVVAAAASDGDAAYRPLALPAELDGLGAGLLKAQDRDAIRGSVVVRLADLFRAVVAVAPAPQEPASNLVTFPPLVTQVRIPHERVPGGLPPDLESSPAGRGPELGKLSDRS